MADELTNRPLFIRKAKDSTGDGFKDPLHPAQLGDPMPEVSLADMLEMAERGEAEVEATVLSYNPTLRKYGVKKLDTKGFLEAMRESPKALEGVRLRESMDEFATDTSDLGGDGSLVGKDFIPLIGGPFFKNLYQYDYFRQANASFYAWNHDPIAHQAINIVTEFTLGRGYRIDSDNKQAKVIWEAFEKTNDLQRVMFQLSRELSIYGETMLWWLPDNQTQIVQNRVPGQPLHKGLIPRLRLIDPTVMWDIITYPEDPSNPLAYVWVAPTQYQVYSGLVKQNVPSAKFIFQTIPAQQIQHYKVNNVTGEKRGRSDLFPALGFLKRLRDSVNYSLIALQKQAAWAIDTTVEGSQADIDAYIQESQAAGTIAPAGSEFVHTAAIKREYKGVEGGRGGANQTFEWALSMAASALGIPISYFGTHLSGGQTRASAIIASEPVAKRFEMRQQVYERIIKDIWSRVMEWAGLGNVECEVTFPDIITADRSTKLRDLALAQSQGWISKERAAEIAAKELGITEYDYELEQEKGVEEQPEGAPLTGAPKLSPLGLSSQQTQGIKRNG